MALTVLRTHDIYDFRYLPNPLEVGDQPLTAPRSRDLHEDPRAGTLEYSNISFPHMHVMNLRRKTRAAVKMINDRPVDTVNFNFQLTGSNSIQYHGLRHRSDTQAGEHYFVHNPEAGYEGIAEEDREMEVLLVSLDKTFFAAALGTGDRWSDYIRNCIETRRAFSGLDRPLPITPGMAQLIGDIRNNENDGPLRALLVQSKVLELIALQVDQCRKPVELPGKVRAEDAEKLHQLKTYLDANFLSDLNLTQLCRYCLLNEFKVKSGFKQLFGSSVFGYIKKKRMEYAVGLLRNHYQTVDEVAATLGYEHPQHFSTAFKNFMGVSPSHYQVRKQFPQVA
jgi:AraC family transcriptional activator of pyochelin receptor